MGALPLSKRAVADTQDVKDRLDKLSGKITEAAEKVHLPSVSLICTSLSLLSILYSPFHFHTAPGNTGDNQSGEKDCRRAV